MNTQEIQGHWGQLRGKLKEKWGQLTNDDLQVFNGNVEQLVYRIIQRTGESRQAVEEFLEKNLDDMSTVADRVKEVKEAVTSQVQGAAEAVHESYEQFSDRAREGYERAEGFVRHHPGESMAATFGLGLVAGVLVGMLICSE